MGKWTDETKEEALSLMRNGKNIAEIAKIVNMSEGSVSLLKYTKFKQNKERIECAICGNMFKQIGKQHLSKHNITLEEYREKYPNHRTCTKSRENDYKNFKSPNKGKTFEEIYGNEEGKRKKEKISEKQIGRTCPKLAGTGITGTRRDTNVFARSTYEANVDRIFMHEGKNFISELDERNERFTLVDNGKEISYQPDRIDLDGLFCKGSYLEIKGYMYPEDWKKIKLFREQYPQYNLLVICPDSDYADINYNELFTKYKDKIDLWEYGKNNYKTRPDLYKIGYIAPKRLTFLKENYPNHINKNIVEEHLLFIAQKCLSYSRVSLGLDIYIDSVKLISISNKRYGASRKSSGVYNYELWEVSTEEGDTFYVTNQDKTVTFYCYKSIKRNELLSFFKDNCDMSLKYGKK